MGAAASDRDPVAGADSHGQTRAEPASPDETVRVALPTTWMLGRYEVTGRLGAGGMGEVLEVQDAELRRTMAAKVMRTKASSGERVARFLREARLTGGLEHPGIPPVHELGRTPEGHPYFTMKRVSGRDLAAHLLELRGRRDRAPATFDFAADRAYLLGVFLKICEAMSFAHSRGVIHRDLKPANVMVGRFGEVLVMDWGLARLEADAASDDEAPRNPLASDEGHTLEGDVLGTPAYMSPEQARGEVHALDQRSDVYALGAMLYEILCLEPPYAGDRMDDVLDDVRAGRLRPLASRSSAVDVPWELDAVVQRAMAADPASRYPSAEALGADVEAYLAGRRVGAARYGVVAAIRKRVAQHPALVRGAAAVVAVVLGMMALARWQRGRSVDALLAQAHRHALGLEDTAALDALDRVLAIALDDSRGVRAREALLEHVARRELAGLPAEAELVALAQDRLDALGRGDVEPVEGADARAARAAHAERFQRACAWLDRGLAGRAYSPELAALRQRAGRGLGWVALLERNHAWARQAFLALAASGSTDEEVGALLGHVARDRDARVALWQRRVREARDDLAAGLDRARPPGAPLREDYLIELSGYRDAAVAADLARVLDEQLGPLAREPAHAWSQAERDLAWVVCHALGRLQLAESVEPLARWLAVCRDPGMAAEAGLALCNTRLALALPPVLAARNAWGANSAVWRRIAGALARVPDPPVALAPNPQERPQALFERAQRLADRGDRSGAIAVYDELVALDPTHVRAYSNRGLLKIELGDLSGGLVDCDVAVRLDPLGVAPWANRGVVKAKLGDHRGAVDDLDRALALSPTHTAAHVARGIARYRLGDAAGALADFDRAIGLEPGQVNAWLNRGELHLEQGRHAEAEADYDAATRADPRCPDGFTGRGRARQACGRHEAARADFDQALVLDPGNADASFSRGNLRLDAADWDGAIADYDAAIRRDPRLAKAWGNRATAKDNRGDVASALGDVRESLRLDAGSWESWATLGVVLVRLGRRPEALEAIGRALELAPPGARARLKELRAWAQGGG